MGTQLLPHCHLPELKAGGGGGGKAGRKGSLGGQPPKELGTPAPATDWKEETLFSAQ